MSIPADNIGIRITKGCMMLPQKSLFWAIGVGKEIITPSEEDNNCENCQHECCTYKF